MAQSDKDAATELASANTPAAATTQVALAAPVELPADLKAALTPGNSQGFLAAKPVQVSAKVEGASAARIVAQLNPAGESRPVAPASARLETPARP